MSVHMKYNCTDLGSRLYDFNGVPVSTLASRSWLAVGLGIRLVRQSTK